VDKEFLRGRVGKDAWDQYAMKLKNKETVEVLHILFEYILDTLKTRLDDVKVDNGRAISFFSKSREIVTINITRKDLRVYIHPPARATFRSNAHFKVEKFRFWESSYQKGTGMYRAMSFWISEKKDLPGAKKIIEQVPKKE
jgi:hypothetical protein